MKLLHFTGAAAIGLSLLMAPMSPVSAAPNSPHSKVRPTGISSLCAYTSRQPTLSLGSTDSVAVRQAQCQLNYAYNAQLVVDGSFGPNTRSATIYFQRCVGIAQDGIIGPNTWSWLNYWTDRPGQIVCR